jgi:UDP-N-acetylglucosamine 2-epimerase (non-hydrolysing)
MKTVLSVVGTRPEAIKMAPVIQELRRHPESTRSIVCVTGQHRQMLEQALALFDIQPDHDSALDPVVRETRPDWVLAQGDTTTVFVAAVVAFYNGVPFGHVEAGLRTGDRRLPFPEEINRRLADAVADLYFAPTAGARQALLHEGVADDRILVTGNTVIDALLSVADRDFDWATAGDLAALPVRAPLVLITAHRRESFGEPFRQLCLAISELAKRFAAEDVHFVYPVHLNPNVRKPVIEILSGHDNVHLVEPVDYLTIVHLMKRAVLVLTDSGGIQEEAPSLKVPVLVMREKTERPEGVAAGVVKLVGTAREAIVGESARLLTDPEARRAMATGANPYGDGHAAERIVAALLA